NRFDSDRPTSRVKSLAPTQSKLSFPVSWSGTDTTTGIREYTIYVSDNNGEFKRWLTYPVTPTGRYRPPDPQALFTGEWDHVYAFYSSAVDRANNVQSPHTKPDTTTFLTNKDFRDFSAQVTVMLGNMKITRLKGYFEQTAKLTNKGAKISGPIWLL